MFMKHLLTAILFLLSSNTFAGLPVRYTELLPYVQAAPNQGETNTCLFMASTGAMELLLNKRDGIRVSRKGGSNDLSESFLIWQRDFYDRTNPSYHFIEAAVKKFNHGEAVHIKDWPFSAYYSDGTDSMEAWNQHPNFVELPRLRVPSVVTELLFARGKKCDTNVLSEEDILRIKQALVEHKSPVIVNYNDDNYWHVVLIVGFDDKVRGTCYEIERSECNRRGAFYVRDSNGRKYEKRAYNWFLYNGNAAAVVKLKEPN